MPVLVGIFTAQMLQDAQLTDIGAQRKQSMQTSVADAEIGRNASAMSRISNQRSAGASGANDSAHQGEWGRPSARRSVCSEMRSGPPRAVRIEVGLMPPKKS